MQKNNSKAFPLLWLPEETLFSLCSRYHTFLGNALPTTTCLELFNSKRDGTQHDFPSNLNYFKHKLGHAVGDTESILRRTIFPFFAPFQVKGNIEKFIVYMEEPSCGKLKGELGILASRFGAEHPLKACTQCMQQDTTLHGVAYWHLPHQLPGVLVCPLHKTVLLECVQKRRWADRFSWILPNDAKLLPPSLDLDTSNTHIFLALASATVQLSTIGLTRTFDPQIVHRTYRTEAIRRFPTSFKGNRELIDLLLRFTRPLCQAQSLKTLPSSPEGADALIQQLLRRPRSHLHPLKHLVFISSIFDDFPDFLTAYDHAKFQDPLLKNETAGNSIALPHRLDKDRKIEPLSLRNKLRPKRLKHNIRQMLLADLSTGTAKVTICARFEITVSTVNKVLRSEPNLKTAWLEAYRKKLLIEQRRNWTAVTLRFHGLSAKAIREHAPSTYAWLYRNDKVWLLRETSSLPTGRLGNHNKVDWAARDYELEMKVRSTLQEVFGADTKPLITARQLYSILPKLYSQMQMRGRYPLTKAYVRSVMVDQGDLLESSGRYSKDA